MGGQLDVQPRPDIPLLNPMGDFEERAADWLPFAEALTRLVEAAVPLPPEEVPLSEARGRALAEAVRSAVTLPRHPNSAMDGYAIQSDDVEGADAHRPRELKVVGRSSPGRPWNGTLEAGQAVRIMTGGPIPTGADGVVRVEDTDREEVAMGRVRVLNDRDRGRHIRPLGEDIREGEVALPAGHGISSGSVALLAGVGRTRVPVHRRARVAILSTGDELVDPATFPHECGDAAIPDSNTPALVAGLDALGCRPHSLGTVPDQEAALEQAIRSGLTSDVLITVGGASMGDADLVKRVLDGLGFELDFWRIRARPGTPFGFGFLPREGDRPQPVLGLPGNPVSAFVTFQLLVRPFILRLMGHSQVSRPTVEARMGTSVTSKGGFRRFIRVTLSGSAGEGWTASPTGPQGSGLVSSIGRADGLAVIPESKETLAPDDPVQVILLGDGPGWPGEPCLAP